MYVVRQRRAEVTEKGISNIDTYASPHYLGRPKREKKLTGQPRFKSAGANSLTINTSSSLCKEGSEKLKVRHAFAALFLFKDVWKGRKPPPDSLTQSLKQPLIPVHVRHYHVEAGCTVMCRINLGRHECPSDQSSMREKKKDGAKNISVNKG